MALMPAKYPGAFQAVPWTELALEDLLATRRQPIEPYASAKDEIQAFRYGVGPHDQGAGRNAPPWQRRKLQFGEHDLTNRRRRNFWHSRYRLRHRRSAIMAQNVVQHGSPHSAGSGTRV